MKKALISGIVFISILLVGCSEEPEVVVLDDSENGENDVNLSPESNFLSELKNEILESIPEQTELDSESIEAIMVDGNFEEMSVSVSFSKDVKVDDAMIQQIVEDSIKKVSETENVEISKENVTIKIEKD
ncbi:hypothetical protein CD33_07590 [Ureibacillus sinduriensis BLB-1 = JCM 15800]|uniref:Topoisomerase n=1 Tax=Ureibacillus sinduriensis BLB-1 = JCM 15800 TaxID=1384057 RepID=A0A0A3HUY2_9BACL|nr:hypothetical protein CD33_07590 [Ureibacillus sinduriensis BLB-1 = JCM 15800]